MAKKDEGLKADTNAWMTTYTDLCTLLLTFFVLLLSIATIDEKKRRVALNSLVGAFGFKPGAQSIIGEPEGMNITLGSAPMKKEEITFEKLQNVVVKNTLEKEVKVVKEADRIVLTLGKRLLFKEGSHEIGEKGKLFLAQLAPIFKGEEGPKLIELRGYVAHAETVFDEDPEQTAILLSTRRALTVFRHFTYNHGVPAERLVAHGFGEPRYVSRSSRQQGKVDRQVQIILDFQEEIPYRLRKRSGDSILDFNGFLFRFPGNMNE
jgi:chemotaxis protein MotB